LSSSDERPLRHLQFPKPIGWLAGGCGESLMRMFAATRYFLNLD